jgi:hypothetical protein
MSRVPGTPTAVAKPGGDDAPPPPADKPKGSNEWLYEDGEGKQVFSIWAARHLFTYAGENRYGCTEESETSICRLDRQEAVWGCHDEVVGNDYTLKVNGNLFQDAVGHSLNYTRKSHVTDADDVVMVRGLNRVWLQSDKEIILQCGQSLIRIAPDGITLTAPMIQLNPPDGTSLASGWKAKLEAFLTGTRNLTRAMTESIDRRFRFSMETLKHVLPLSPAKKTAERMAHLLSRIQLQTDSKK